MTIRHNLQCFKNRDQMSFQTFINVRFTDRADKQRTYWRDILTHLEKPEIKRPFIERFGAMNYEPYIDFYTECINELDKKGSYGLFEAEKDS